MKLLKKTLLWQAKATVSTVLQSLLFFPFSKEAADSVVAELFFGFVLVFLTLVFFFLTINYNVNPAHVSGWWFIRSEATSDVSWGISFTNFYKNVAAFKTSCLLGSLSESQLAVSDLQVFHMSG